MSTHAAAAPPPPRAAPIGLLGGSFDPVHIGHLHLAHAAQEELGLDQVVFVPAGQPWQKGPITPAAQRLDMLEAALAAQPRWRIDRCELDRAGPSYTIETLQALRGALAPEQSLVWILGEDQLLRLPTWHRWEELLGLAHFAYTRRAGGAQAPQTALPALLARAQSDVRALHTRASGALVEFAMPAVPCSSSDIRSALGAGDARRAESCLPGPVLAYIRNHALYGAAHG